MDNTEDVKRILKGSPWIVRNVWMIVHPWDRKVSIKDLNFSLVPLWIQLWGLPIHCKTATIGKSIGEQPGEVMDSAVYELADKAKFVNIKILFNISDPIRAGLFIGNKVDGVNWIDFRFENLPMFCFKCGLIDHIEDNCINTQEEEDTIEVETVNPRGAWLGSNNYGRRVVEKKEKTFRSDPRKSLSGGLFSPVPKELSDIMAKLNMDSESQEDSATDQYHNVLNQKHQYETEAAKSKQENNLKRKTAAATGITLSFEYP
ncbi:putative transcription factor interactor and regulator CCHC(Zn) family [Medicago truncatula]|uniref:Putative transcription factor interactor and regulator CCHC(Zn) family n=1 Tax=Medicago truncatula TaxID=3880 RepID=A0A396HPV9_MEDTR|nr:putative transcription factor interactor and regulator CCHC(Zn) family [Medicago truncatula]